MVARRYPRRGGLRQRFEVFSLPDGKVLERRFSRRTARSDRHRLQPDGRMSPGWTTTSRLGGGRLQNCTKSPGSVSHLRNRLQSDGNHVAAGTKDGNLLVFDVKAGKTAAVLPSPRGLIRSVRFSRDGSRVAPWPMIAPCGCGPCRDFARSAPTRATTAPSIPWASARMAHVWPRPPRRASQGVDQRGPELGAMSREVRRPDRASGIGGRRAGHGHPLGRSSGHRVRSWGSGELAKAIA